MSCALPVFTTPHGAVGLDYCEPGKNVIIANDKEIVGQINTCLFDEPLMIQVSEASVNTIEKYYSTLTNEVKLRKALDDVLS
jgi:hypothetical protein